MNRKRFKELKERRKSNCRGEMICAAETTNLNCRSRWRRVIYWRVLARKNACVPINLPNDIHAEQDEKENFQEQWSPPGVE